MKNFVILLSFLTSLFISCKKEPLVYPKDINIIRGKIVDDSIHWKINHVTVQPVMNTWDRFFCVKNNYAIRKSIFSYRHEDFQKSINEVIISSPAFNIKDSLSKKKYLFTIGLKEFNNADSSALTGFKVDVTYKKELYSSSYNSQVNSSLEIIELEFVPYRKDPEKYIVARTKIKVNCDLFDSNKVFIGKILDLTMHAEFMLEKE